MKTIQGIYDGKRINPLEPVDMPANVRVFITFIDSPVPSLPVTRIQDVAGCLAYKGKPKTLRDMEHAIAKGARAHRS